MSDNVVSLRGGSLDSDRKQAFLNAVATSYEAYVDRYGYEPEAIVYTMLGLKQVAWTGWLVQGDSQGGSSSILALAGVAVTREVIKEDEE